MNARKLVVGCGYLGRRVARRWRADGATVYATTRDPQRTAELAAEGFTPIVADVTRPESLDRLPAVDTVLYSVGYQRGDATTTRQALYCDGLAAVLDRLPAEVQRVVFISSTGVYGDAGGAWVDESTPCTPTREAGLAFLAGERRLLAGRWGSRGTVLRLAGLYGPGRVPMQRQILDGQPIPLRDADSYLNLIHADDAAAVVLAAEQASPGGRVYLVSDGHPVTRREYFEIMAQLLGQPGPRFEPEGDDSPNSRRSGDHKRISNARMLAELSVRLAYPNCRAGLSAILSS